MSGLIGLINFPANLLDGCKTRIGDRLRRFPWNTWDWWTAQDHRSGLGRVDIGVFNPQPQPAIDLDSQIVALLSGELYRTEDLRNELEQRGYMLERGDDPELALYAYLAYGREFVSQLEGVFHLAIFDQRVGSLLIANDRFGLRPLYWAHYGGKFVFGPEVKIILEDPAFEKTLNIVAVAEYMRFQQLLGDKTFFEGISLLPVASVLTYDLSVDRVEIQPYWTFADIPECRQGIDYEEAVREAVRLFQAAVDRLSSGGQRVGLYLSGGLDSRLIAGCLAKKQQAFDTITYGQAGSIDVVLAKRIAKAIGSMHHWHEFRNGEWILDHVDLHLDLTEGYHSWIHSHGMSTLEEARFWLRVNLTGLNVDTLIGPYLSSTDIADASDYLAFNCSLFHFCNQNYTWPGLTEAEERLLYTTRYAIQSQGLAFESLRAEMSRCAAQRPEVRWEEFKIVHHNRRMTQNYIVFNSSHFENRFPGYDYSLFDFVETLPVAMRSDRRLEQDMIERIAPALALIPRSRDGLLFTRRRGRRMVHHIVTRLKQRANRHIGPIFSETQSLYADYEGWLRNELRPWAQELLLDGRMASRGMFSEDFVRSLLNRQFSGCELHTIGKIAPIMTFEMMMRAFFD